MGFKMYSGVKDDEYNLMDSIVEEQFEIGGTTAWIYAYLGPRGNKGSTDATKPDYETLGSKVTDIGNMIWMESPDRKYSVDAISLPIVYQVQDGNMEMQIPGLFLFETMEVTVPYNMMIARLGRKIVNGDVIELANLRDADLLTEGKEGLNRFYVVHDSYKAARGYSHTWFHHIWTLKLVPLTDSPEFRDILGTGANADDLKNSSSSYNREMDIVKFIVGQADSEVPYMHWDHEHIHQFKSIPPIEQLPQGYGYPKQAPDGYYFVIKSYPTLNEYNDSTLKWDVVPVYGIDYTLPLKDGDFKWQLSEEIVDKLELFQYFADTNKIARVLIEEFEVLPKASTSSGFAIIKATQPQVKQYVAETQTWVDAHDEQQLPYVTNKNNQQDQREKLPPMSKIAKGAQFPQDPKENMWFLRTDVEPNVLWKYEKNVWRKFNYGGRFAWTGTDDHKASFINNREKYDQNGVQTPSRQNIADAIKPQLDD